MELRSRLNGINAFEWFLIAFAFLIVGAAGYALGTNAVKDDVVPKRLENKLKQFYFEDDRMEPLQGPPTNLQPTLPDPYKWPANRNPQNSRGDYF